MAFGTANGKLKKLLLFNFVKLANLDTCFRCGQKIRSLNEFSVDHKEPWLNAEKPVETFFDIGNVAYSHLKCNTKVARRPNKKYDTKEERLIGQRQDNLAGWHRRDDAGKRRLRRQKIRDAQKDLVR